MSTEPEMTAQEKITGIAREALESHPRDYESAKSLFLQVIRGDAELLWEAFYGYRGLAAQVWIQRAGQQKRAETEAQPAVSPRAPVNRAPPPAVSGLRVAGAVAALSLLDTFKVNGQSIGDITPKEARAWAGARERDARFVRALTANLPEDLPIRKFRDGVEAARIYEEATNAQ